MKPQELEAIPQAFESKMRELQLRIMEDIVRRLRQNAGEVTAAAQWQMQRAYELGVSKQALHQLLEQVAAELEMQVDEVYDSRLANVYSADRQCYRAVGKPFIEYAENKELQQLIGAVKAQTKDEFRNITQSMGFALPSGEGGKIEFHPIADYYQKTLDGAVMDIASGAFDYNTVLKRITHEMTNSGVRTVAYASGHTDRIEVAARRAVMTGFHQVVAKKAEQDMAALGTNYVEVTWHRGARPSHQVWQGKVYFWDRGFDDSLAEPPETLDNSAESGIMETRNENHLRISMQFFSESDIYRQESVSLKRAIRKYKKNIQEHTDKINNPSKYVDGWKLKTDAQKQGLIRHWEKEIRNFNNSISEREKELKKRGDYDE